jgi:hypothetical protein
MNVFYILFFPLVLLSSCKSLRVHEDEVLKTVHIHGTVHKPYCGGAKPSPEMAFGYDEPLRGLTFHVLQGSKSEPDNHIVKEFTLDQDGNSLFKLPQGKYFLKLADKNLSLDEFIKKFSVMPNELYKIKTDACFDEWRKEVDLYLDITSDTLIEFRQNGECWVGTNPCMEYVGPPAR